MDEHEHAITEWRDESGQLVAGPCIECGMAAIDAMDTLKQERDRLLRMAQSEWGDR